MQAKQKGDLLVVNYEIRIAVKKGQKTELNRQHFICCQTKRTVITGVKFVQSLCLVCTNWITLIHKDKIISAISQVWIHLIAFYLAYCCVVVRMCRRDFIFCNIRGFQGGASFVFVSCIIIPYSLLDY
jgi:hypothetical protein